MLVGGSAMTIPLPMSQCVVPDGINGPVAIFVTSDGQPLLNNVRDRAQNKIVAGPTLAFIDTKPQMLVQLARGAGSGSGAAAQSSTSTRTITPAEASAVVSSANGATSTDSSVPSGASVTPGASAVTSAASSAPTGNAASSGPAGGPNQFTGKSPDGAVTVNGWKNV